MEAKASPRKPKVRMFSRSSWVAILLVAWRIKATGISSVSMPLPLSATSMHCTPPRWMDMVTWDAPASMAFSSSSFTTEAGRSTTSPAAMSSAVC